MLSNKYILLYLGILFPYLLCAQAEYLPQASIYDIRGQEVNSHELADESDALLLIFWHSDNKSCRDMLEDLRDEISEVLSRDSLEVKIICKVPSMQFLNIINLFRGMEIPFEIYFDKRDELARGTNVSNYPSILLFDISKRLVCRRSFLCDGFQCELEKEIKKCFTYH